MLEFNNTYINTISHRKRSLKCDITNEFAKYKQVGTI